MLQEVKRLLDAKFNIIPLTKDDDGKGCHIKDWQNIKFEASDFNENNNIGINLHQSGLADVDLDSLNAEIFGRKFLNSNTYIFGIKDSKGFIKHTHYLFNNSKKLLFVKREYPNKSTIAELQVEGNTVCPPSVAKSKLFNNEWCQRVWIKADIPMGEDPNLLEKFLALVVSP